MPTIVNGHLAPGPRRYTAHELLTRALYPLLHPSILTLRDVAWAVYIIYIARVTYLTLRSIAYIVFEAEGRRRWTEPRPEWGPPPEGWTMGWTLMARMLRRLVWRRVLAWGYEVFAWGFVGVVVVFCVEEGVRWRRDRRVVMGIR